MTEEQLTTKKERLDNAIRRFHGMGEDYEAIMEWLREGAWMKPHLPAFDVVTSQEFAAQFPAAATNPAMFATYLDGRRSMVLMLEEGE